MHAQILDFVALQDLWNPGMIHTLLPLMSRRPLRMQPPRGSDDIRTPTARYKYAMEDTIAAVSAARAANCTLECEIDAFCAAGGTVRASSAKPTAAGDAQLWRVGPDSVVLSVESDLMHVVPWSKIVVVAECSPCMDNDWAAECVGRPRVACLP